MSSRRVWIGRLFLRFPNLLRFIRNLPIVGEIAHRVSHRLLPGRENVWARVEDGTAEGLWFELNPRTGEHYRNGTVEPAIQEILAAYLRPGMVFYDLGANIGFFSLLAARIVGRGGTVVSFEPDSETAYRLRRNIDRNELANICVVERGIWSQTMLVNFVPADASSPDRGLGRFDVGLSSVEGNLMSCVSLDDFITDAKPPDVIKCDIEGAELEAFRGAERLLSIYRPLIVCELHSEQNGIVLRERFVQLGYRVEWIDELHILAVPQTARM